MTKIVRVKLVHTAIWVAFNVIFAYLAYAVTSNKIDKWVWICIGSILTEGLVLLIFKGKCPLTLVAEKYAIPNKDNFDIYLPNWLAKNNKLIYTTLFAIIIGILICRLIPM